MKIFLYFEEIDLCKKVKLQKGKIFLHPKIIIRHEGASSVKKFDLDELEKIEIGIGCGLLSIFIRNKGFIIALVLIFPKLISSF